MIPKVELESGEACISKVMRRLLTWYAVYFNEKYKRHGQLYLTDKLNKDRALSERADRIRQYMSNVKG
jgi:hypothetical protein